MRIAWLSGLLFLVSTALFVVLGGAGERINLTSETRALAGTILGVALSAIVANVNSLLSEREAKHSVVVSTLDLMMDLSFEMGLVDVLLRALSEEPTDETRHALRESVKKAIVHLNEISTRLGEKHPKRNLAAKRLKMGLAVFARMFSDASLEDLRAQSEACRKLLKGLDTA